MTIMEIFFFQLNEYSLGYHGTIDTTNKLQTHCLWGSMPCLKPNYVVSEIGTSLLWRKVVDDFWWVCKLVFVLLIVQSPLHLPCHGELMSLRNWKRSLLSKQWTTNQRLHSDFIEVWSVDHPEVIWTLKMYYAIHSNTSTSRMGFSSTGMIQLHS